MFGFNSKLMRLNIRRRTVYRAAFSILFLALPFTSVKADLPEHANEDYPCFVRYEPYTAFGKWLTGSKSRLQGLVSYYLRPPMANELGWTLVKDDRGVVFCTGTSWGDGIVDFFGDLDLKGRHSLWKSSDGDRIYLFDPKTNKQVHVWSRVREESGFDELWVNHIHNIAWGDRLYETQSDESGVFNVDIPMMLTYDEAIERADDYSIVGIPAGSFSMPTITEAADGIDWGLIYLLPGMQDRDEYLSNPNSSYRNFYWLQRPQGENHKTEALLSGSSGLISTGYFAFRGKGRRFYVRYLIRGDNFKRLQEEGLIPVQEVY